MAECLGQQLPCHVHWTLLLQECLWQIDTSVRDGERKGSVVAGFDLLSLFPRKFGWWAFLDSALAGCQKSKYKCTQASHSLCALCGHMSHILNCYEVWMIKISGLKSPNETLIKNVYIFNLWWFRKKSCVIVVFFFLSFFVLSSSKRNLWLWLTVWFEEWRLLKGRKKKISALLTPGLIIVGSGKSRLPPRVLWAVTGDTRWPRAEWQPLAACPKLLGFSTPNPWHGMWLCGGAHSAP